jgi:archaellin
MTALKESGRRAHRPRRDPEERRGPARRLKPARQMAHPRRLSPVRRLVPVTAAPAVMQLLLAVLVAASVVWGAVGAWTVGQHASAAHNVVATSEPLSLDAQRMYQSLADADIIVTTAFLSGPDEPLSARDSYQADITRAAAELADLKQAAATGADPQLDSSLAAISSGLPVYTGYVAEAQADDSLGFQLTGGSFIQVASEEMHLTLLPAARSSYDRENAGLSAASGRATSLPLVIATVCLAAVTAVILLGAQRWLRRRTHRTVNYGLVAASALLVVATVWLVVVFMVARGDLQRGVGHGATPAETLAQASIAVQQARGDELLNLISRTGDTSFQQNFEVVRAELGPGPGTLLTSADASSRDEPGSRWAAAAERDAQAWYLSNDQVYRLDVAANYAAETQLVIGTGPGSSAAGFRKLEADLGQAIAADQVVFASNANAGAGAFTGLEVGVIAAAVLMAAGSAWGLGRRIAEYR